MITEEEKHKGNNTKASGAAALITLILVIAFAAATQYYLKNGKGSAVLFQGDPQNTEQLTGDREVFYEPGDRPFFAGTSSSVILTTRDGVKAQNITGELLWDIHFSMQNNPIARTAGKFILAADQGGNDFALLEGGRIRWNKKLDNNIINASLNSNGEITVVKEEKGYRGALAVFDANGNEKFTYLMANDFPAGSSVSSDGKFITLNSIDTSGVKTNSNITFLDSKGEVKGTVGRPGELIAGIGFIQNDMLAAIAGNAIYIYDKEGKPKWERQYADKPLYTVELNSGKSIFAAYRPISGGAPLDGSKSIVQAIDLLGHNIFETEIDGEVKALVSTKDYLAANLGKKLLVFTQKGKLINSYTSPKDIKQVIYLEEERSFVLVTRDSLVQVKVK